MRSIFVPTVVLSFMQEHFSDSALYQSSVLYDINKMKMLNTYQEIRAFFHGPVVFEVRVPDFAYESAQLPVPHICMASTALQTPVQVDRVHDKFMRRM